VFSHTPIHLTEFCHEVVPVDSNKTPAGTVEFTYRLQNCPTHNCFDEQCPDYKVKTQ
jgi:hypothetical protein